jgi:hypothetical protein
MSATIRSRRILQRPQLFWVPTVVALIGGAAWLILASPSLPRFLPFADWSASGASVSRLGNLASAVAQVAGGAFVAGVAVTFLGAQIVGGHGAARRLRSLFNASPVLMLHMWTPAVGASLAALVLARSGPSPSEGRAWTLGLVLAIVASFAAVAALLVEQRGMTDPYHLAHVLARSLTPATLTRFGFISPQTRAGFDATGTIVRYNLDYRTPDPMGPISEVFWQAVRERDRVLLQAVADEIAARAVVAAGLRYRRLSFTEMTNLAATDADRRPLRILGRRRATRSLGLLLFCNHYIVRNGPNAVRELRLQNAVDPFLLALVRQITTMVRHRELEEHVAVSVRALAAMCLSVGTLSPTSGHRAVEVVPRLAQYLDRCGSKRDALLLALVCGWLVAQRDASIDMTMLAPRLERAAELAVHRVRNDPEWVPNLRRRNVWMSMIPELRERSQPK